jgi:hypothetical protein
MFSKAKVGDQVYDYLRNEFGIIVSLNDNKFYPIRVVYADSSKEVYTKEGYLQKGDKNPILFWNYVPTIVPPSRPKKKIKVEQWVTIKPVPHAPTGFHPVRCYDTEEAAKATGRPYGSVIVEVEED